MLGKFGLALALMLNASVARAMPGTASIDISPTVPCASELIDLRSDLAKPVHLVTLQIAPSLGRKCAPSL